MPEGAFTAAVSSPPYEGDILNSKSHGIVDERRIKNNYDIQQTHYGDSENQLGAISGDTFWSAARIIVAQTYAALRPGGHAIWIVKSFVRNKALVDFPGQWRELCESVGFVTLHEHHAMLVDDKGTQTAIDGNHKQHKTERKSFFRRLAEKKGSPRIDYETVLCMMKL